MSCYSCSKTIKFAGAGIQFAINRQISGMRNGSKITIGITLITALGIVIYFARKKRQDRIFTRLDMIAEEGYETAGDILFPLKRKKLKKNRDYYDYNDFSTN